MGGFRMKPFNLKRALAGDPICDVDGNEVCIDGLIADDGELYKLNGRKYCSNEKALFLAPPKIVKKMKKITYSVRERTAGGTRSKTKYGNYDVYWLACEFSVLKHVEVDGQGRSIVLKTFDTLEAAGHYIDILKAEESEIKKVKKSGWINLYAVDIGSRGRSGTQISSFVYPTKDEAEKLGYSPNKYITTIEIFWEEEE